MMQLKLCLVASGYCFCETLELSPKKLDEEQHLLLLILRILAVHLKLLQEVFVPLINCLCSTVCVLKIASKLILSDLIPTPILSQMI